MGAKPEKPSGGTSADPTSSSEISALPEPVPPVYGTVVKAHESEKSVPSDSRPTSAPSTKDSGDR